MATIIPPGYAQVSVEHWLVNYTRPAVTTWGVSILGTGLDGADGLATRFWGLYSEAFRSQMDSNVAIRDTRIVIGQDGGEPLVGFSASSVQGAQTRESVAPALALMIDRRTGIGGRANRGRVYMPWAVSDANVSEQGAVAEVTRNAWTGLALDFMAAINDDEYFGELVILHSSPTRMPTPITNMAANGVIRTQKQRQARF